MDLLGFKFTFIDFGLAALLLIFFMIQLYYYLRYFRGIIRRKKSEEQGKILFSEKQEPVSVVICSRDEEENLRKFLPFILEQDYPDFEVIVVNDASYDNTDDYLSLMMKSYPNLHKTFIPYGTTNLSTKKLGITLGIKAARNELILLTDADCMPEGKDWIARMVRNFMPETEFVLGFGGYIKKKGFLNKMIRYDTLFAAIQYLGMAKAGKPYMGVGRNLAYRKKTFLAMKGFAGTLNLTSGDDDLFVNKGATAQNTRIEVTKEGSTWSEPKRTFRQWFAQKERHLSVSEYYSSDSKLRLSIEPISRGFFYLTLIGMVVWGCLNFNWIVPGFAILVFIIRLIIQIATINKSAKIVGESRFYLTIPLFDIILPLITFNLLIFGKKNYNIKWK